jgi:leader peptidase (prepilin peptidase)/N-methyltransferase
MREEGALMSLEYPFDYAIVFILGTLFGSFANVCIYRLPQRLSIIFPGSHCPSCQEALRPWHNIPLLSYLLLGGQCARCKAAISLRYPLIELSNGLLYIFLYHQYHLSVQTAVFALLTTALLIVSCIDLAHTIIPDAITLPGIVVGLGTSLWLTPIGLRNAILGVILGGGLFLLMAILSVVILKREGMGGGDIKLIAMLGAFLGWHAVLVTIFLAAVLGASVGLALILLRRKGRREPLPFGPFLALGALLAMVWGETILTWYVSRSL